jgi:hypothetical protein
MLLVARCAIEGVLFAGVLALAQVGMAGDRPVPVVPVALAVTGIGIILASILRDARAERQNATIALGMIGIAAAYGVILTPPHPEVVAILGRVIAFGIVGEAFVWRNLTVARSLLRWSDTRDAGMAAIAVLAITSLLPVQVDRSGLLALGLVAIAATGIGLSLARSAEELFTSGRGVHGEATRSTASGTALIIAVLAIAGAFVAPFVGDLLGQIARTVDEILATALYGVLLAFGYLAALVVALFIALGVKLNFRAPAPPTPLDRAQELEALRQLEATRPYVVGVIEILIAIVALAAVVILVDRMARERRGTLPEGATLERDVESGDGLGAFLAGLLPRRARRARAPREDGTAAGALRALYWRYLAQGDAQGVAWRGVGETPAEHHRRALHVAPAHGAATALVRAFEDLRYGDRVPDDATLAAARRGLAALEQP